VADLKYKCSYEADTSNIEIMFLRSTSHAKMPTAVSGLHFGFS
jgi:hypothetical protein